MGVTVCLLPSPSLWLAYFAVVLLDMLWAIEELSERVDGNRVLVAEGAYYSEA